MSGLSASRRPRPVWNNEESYGDPNKWTYRQWAWEFLRRNKAYQKLSDSAVHPHQKEFQVREFGRCNFKRYKDPYGKDDQGRCWLPEVVAECKFIGSGSKDVSLTLSQGQIALVFDLEVVLQAGRTSLGSMLDHAKELLGERLATYENDLPREKQSKIPKVHRGKLFLWLRVYDAIDYYAQSEVDVAKELYPHTFDDEMLLSESGKTKAYKKIRADLARARHMVEQGYLELVPLDYIQDKSTKRIV